MRRECGGRVEGGFEERMEEEEGGGKVCYDGHPSAGRVVYVRSPYGSFPVGEGREEGGRRERREGGERKREREEGEEGGGGDGRWAQL
jgi:hypothetical protein